MIFKTTVLPQRLFQDTTIKVTMISSKVSLELIFNLNPKLIPD